MKRRGRKRSTKLIAVELVDIEFEFDAGNLEHLRLRQVDSRFVNEIYLDRPRFAHNPEHHTRSATHIMVGESNRRGIWTVAMVATGPRIWRPITAYPSDAEEVIFWRRSSS